MLFMSFFPNNTVGLDFPTLDILKSVLEGKHSQSWADSGVPLAAFYQASE